MTPATLKALAAKYQPDMPLELLHSWAEDAQALLEQIGGADAGCPSAGYLQYVNKKPTLRFLSFDASVKPSEKVLWANERRWAAVDAGGAALTAYESKHGSK